MEPMLGMIYMIPFDWAPRGYLKCQGQVLNVQQYQAVFSLVAYTYGGNNSSTFGIPDLQGRAPVGTGVLPTSHNPLNLATKLGAETATLTVPNLPPHNHGATFAPTTGSQPVNLPEVPGTLKVQVKAGTDGTGVTAPANNLLGAPSSTKLYTSNPTTTVALADAAVSVTGNPTIPAQTVNITTVTGGTVTVNPTGSGAAFGLYQPSLALSFIIAMNGLYPDRP